MIKIVQAIVTAEPDVSFLIFIYYINQIKGITLRIIGIETKSFKFFLFSIPSITAAPTASPQTLTVVRHRSRNQSMTRIRATPSSDLLRGVLLAVRLMDCSSRG